jgi:hypothetical protein
MHDRSGPGCSDHALQPQIPGFDNYWPVPVRLSVCGLPASLSFTLRIPLRAPIAVGLKFTVIVQVPPLAATDPHPVEADAMKSFLSVPEIDTVDTDTESAGLWLVSVTVAEEVVPTATVPKPTGDGESVT